MRRVRRLAFLYPPAKTMLAIGVGRKLISRCWFSHHTRSASRFEVPLKGDRARAAPIQRVGQISHVAASNPNSAKLEVVFPALRWKALQCQEIRFERPWCSMTTPLGLPVEPEV